MLLGGSRKIPWGSGKFRLGSGWVPDGSGRFRLGSGWVPGGSGWFREVPAGSGWVPRFTYTLKTEDLYLPKLVKQDDVTELCLASSTRPRRRNLLAAPAQYTVSHFRWSSTKSSSWFSSSVISLLPSTVVQQVTVDFEKGLWSALRTVLPDVQIRGCVFHWTQPV